MTLTKNLAFTVFGAYVALGPGVYTAGLTQVNSLGYVHYENVPPKQSHSTYQVFRLSTDIDNGSAAAFIFLINSP